MLSWNKVNVVSSLWSHLRYFGWHVGCYQIWHRYLCIINLFKKLMSLLVHLALGSQWSIRGTMSEVALTASINLLSINIQGTQDQVRKSPWPEVLDLVMDPRHHKLPFFFFLREAAPCGFWDIFSPTRDWTEAAQWKHWVWTTGPPGSPIRGYFNWLGTADLPGMYL